jgi:hypothetical protein
MYSANPNAMALSLDEKRQAAAIVGKSGSWISSALFVFVSAN